VKPQQFIFQDPQGRRWPRLRRVLLIWTALGAGAMVWFAWSVFVRPQLALPLPIRQLKGQLKAAINLSERSPDDPNAMNWQRFYDKSQAAQERVARIREQWRKPRKEQGEIRLGIYADWDSNSLASLEEHAGALTHVAAPWFTLTDTTSNLLYEPDAKLVTYAASRGLTVMPILDNLVGTEWQPEAVENLANGPAQKRAQFIAELVRDLKESKVGGVILNWEQVDPASKDAYTTLVAQMSDALHDADKELWFMVSMGDDFDTFDLDEMANSVDRFVAQFHDENSDTDAPGPIASIPWLEGWLKVVTDTAGTDQWIGVLGAYAYDWNTTTKKTDTIGFKDAMSRASYAGVDQAGQKVEVAAPNYNGMFDFTEGEEAHTIAFLDAISFYNQLLLVRGAKLGGVGINRLGSEDPQIWDVLEPRGPPQKPLLNALGKLHATETVTHVGRGEVVTVDEARDDGTRTVTLEPGGRLRANYTDFPTYPILYHQGAGDPHQVSITFDDGPDPTWTPKILDILKARGVKACFFLIGQNAEDHPGLVERIVREGHEIGNHTYNHANLALMSAMRMRLELNATQSVIEAITGRSTTLFRPPYNADSTPTSIAELVPLKLAQDELGYTVVLENVDPQDWARPGTDTIVQRVKELRSEGSIVLLHDAGGDRSQTVAALPRIIDYLETRGDHIVPISELLKISHDALMPRVDVKAQPVQRIVSGTGFRIWHAIIEFFWAFMIFATALVALRTFIVAWLAHRHHLKVEGRRSKVEGANARVTGLPSTPITVIIAAYNEGKVIVNTLRSVVDTDYTGQFEVIVVDDGSKDDTAAEVERMAAAEPRIHLIRQANTGKAGALGNGLARARYDIIVFLDADTLFERGTLAAIVEPFANPLVGAVSGHARVGNTRSFIAKCQSLEYICGFNLDRRAFTEWNCITVVPGAISAFRRSAIEAAGGFSHDTLAEDTDLTLMLHRLGYQIEYAPNAVAWTEAPETYATLAKQRFRWAYGTMQCLWKHRDLVFNPRYGALGWFSLPGIWFFQIALVALTPFVDGLLLYSALFGHATAIWYYLVAFIAMDLLLATLACHIDEEPPRTALWIIPMRLVYRPLLAWVIWKSIFRALKGALVGWGKLERTGAALAGN
jgi:cellulose synthase/poly-beta-1,6-N-acetylglucosamine synthase-like glycosyltransferase/peptidoglycan/xylan/chitin deacetylase (PgdA/CDA1 family)/spore germination protein YaaH